MKELKEDYGNGMNFMVPYLDSKAPLYRSWKARKEDSPLLLSSATDFWPSGVWAVRSIAIQLLVCLAKRTMLDNVL